MTFVLVKHVQSVQVLVFYLDVFCSCLDPQILTSAGSGSRSQECFRSKDQYTKSGLEDLCSQAKKIEAKKICFAKQDGASVHCAVEKLREEGHFMVLKMTTDAVLEGSDADPQTFILIIHTKYQMECWRKWGSDFAGLNVTHNMTHYENMSLFTIMTQDQWTRELWELLKTWIWVTDLVEFQSYWGKIQMIAPLSMTEYLCKYWMGGKDDDWTTRPKLWSAVYQTKRGIFQLGDTNMLVEAWHHLLKAISHFIARHDRQHIGCEGLDALALARNRANDITPGNGDEPTTFAVHSQSWPDVSYLVDIDAYDCNCPEFAKVKYCKHMRAVQIKFPESRITYPISAVETHIMLPSKELESLDIVIPAELSIQGDSSAIKQQLQSLLLTLDANPSLALPNSLFELSSQVQSVQQDLHDAGLPPRKSVTPNQHTVIETAETMGIRVKSKCPRQHLDPYSGNERPGKKAKEDARGPLDNISLLNNVAHFMINASVSSAQTLPSQPAPLTPPVMQTLIVRKVRDKFHRKPAKQDSQSQLLSPAASHSHVQPAQDDRDASSQGASGGNSLAEGLSSVNELDLLLSAESYESVQSPGALVNTTMLELAVGSSTATGMTGPSNSIGPALVQGLQGVSMGDVNAPMFSNNNIQQIDRAIVQNYYGTQEVTSDGRFTVIREGDIFLQHELCSCHHPFDRYHDNQVATRDFTGTVKDSPKLIWSYYGEQKLENFEEDYQIFRSVPRHPHILQLYGVCKSPGLTALVFHGVMPHAYAVYYCDNLTDPFEFCLQTYKLARQRPIEILGQSGLGTGYTWRACPIDMKGNILLQHFDSNPKYRLRRLVHRDLPFPEFIDIDPRILKHFETKSFTKENLLKYYDFLFHAPGESHIYPSTLSIHPLFWELFSFGHPEMELPRYLVHGHDCKLVFNSVSHDETRTYESGIVLTLLPDMSIRFQVPISRLKNTTVTISERLYLLHKGASQTYHIPFVIWASQAHHLLQDATNKSSLGEMYASITHHIYLYCRINLKHINNQYKPKLRQLADDLDIDSDFLYLFHNFDGSQAHGLSESKGQYPFWAKDQKGEHRVADSIIQDVFGVTVYWNWGVEESEFPRQYYSVLHDIHKACRFDPYSTGVADYLGVPLLKQMDEISGLKEWSDGSENGSSDESDYASANEHMEY
ncbi:hypothetical protein C8J56DRAFT_1067274 [Mycena floridula]|nr:hypothetical protein C8J56DRAFT_1067274 [Mycena floridula]